MTFAAITAALIIGALAERVRFSATMLFALLWLTIVYAPLAHMVWASEGLLFGLGAIDFAGGTVVHINSGIAGLVGVAFAGPRLGHLKESMPPHSLALTMTGAGLLWVGWFGFNAGSALEANGLAAVAMINTFVAPAAGLLTWMGVERLVSGKPSMLGGASGAVAGLVAVTPAAGISGPIGAMVPGRRGEPRSAMGSSGRLKNRLRLDDSLDVFGIHGLGGIAGSMGTAIVALPALGGHGGARLCIRASTRGAACRGRRRDRLVGCGIGAVLRRGQSDHPAAPGARRRARGARHRRSRRTRIQFLSGGQGKGSLPGRGASQLLGSQ